MKTSPAGPCVALIVLCLLLMPAAGHADEASQNLICVSIAELDNHSTTTTTTTTTTTATSSESSSKYSSESTSSTSSSYSSESSSKSSW